MSGIHSHPFRYFDRLVERGRDHCTVLKLISGDETLQDGRGRSPRPCPAALVVEALAQAALPLAEGGAGGETPPGLLVGMDEVRVHRDVWPGDRLLIRAEIVGRLGGMIRVRSEAEVEGVLVAEGELTIAAGRD